MNQEKNNALSMMKNKLMEDGHLPDCSEETGIFEGIAAAMEEVCVKMENKLGANVKFIDSEIFHSYRNSQLRNLNK